ncbi:MAG: TIGR03905 family TSCPD domain-containing protein [Defluviitaleaceae bacterium]|nr:TIGR03905 family TSCPD domain-containing protein [Defluviitaleaceae bacterium]
MTHSYQTKDVCPSSINFELDGDVVRNVEFTGGCPGNLITIPKLVDGFTVDKLVSHLGGIKCGRRHTSCADQLSKAVQEAYNSAKANS